MTTTYYPIILHKDPSSDYGVIVPDLPGCYSAGSTVEEAISMAREAIELHIEGLAEQGRPVPQPSPIERLRQNVDYQDGKWALVPIDRVAPRANPTA